MGYYDLTTPQKALYIAAIQGSHKMDVRLSLYDMDEAFLGTPAFNIVEGQIDGDQTADVQRQLKFTVVQLGSGFWGPTSSLFVDNIVGVEYGTFVPTVGWVWDWVFYGPVTKYSRDGFSHHIECSSKEVLMMPPVRQPILSNPQSRLLINYIQSAAEDFGETKFDLGAFTDKIRRHYRINPRKAIEKGVWWYLQRLSSKLKYNLFFSNAGYLTLAVRDSTQAAIFTWHDVVTAPTHEFDMTTVINRVEVYSKDKRGTDMLKGIAELLTANPLSPESLSRGGKCLTLLEEIHVDHPISRARAQELAEDTLSDAVSNVIDVSFESYPVPFLEIGDVCSVTVHGDIKKFTLKKYSLSLLPNTMSVGYTSHKRPLKKFKNKPGGRPGYRALSAIQSSGNKRGGKQSGSGRTSVTEPESRERFVIHGTVVNVTRKTEGDYLAVDAGIGAGVLTVDDASVFDEDGGRLVFVDDSGTTFKYFYDSVDIDANTIALTSILAEAYAKGEGVYVSPLHRTRVASVSTDDPLGEIIEARVPHHLKPLIRLGARSGIEGDDEVADENDPLIEVLCTLIHDDWVVTDVLGREPEEEYDEIKFIRWESKPGAPAGIAAEAHPWNPSKVLAWKIMTIDNEDAPAGGITAHLELSGVDIGSITLSAGDRVSNKGFPQEDWGVNQPLQVIVDDNGGMTGRLGAIVKYTTLATEQGN